MERQPVDCGPGGGCVCLELVVRRHAAGFVEFAAEEDDDRNAPS